MKNLLLLFLCLMSLSAIGQFPVTQSSGSASTLVYSKGAYGSDSGFVFRVKYVDTSAANIGWIDNIPGIVIRVGDSLFLRNNTATKWMLVNEGGSGGASSRWSILGNSGTVAGTNFLGTTDSVRLDLRTNNTIRQSITGSGNVGIGTTTPQRKFEVNGTMYLVDEFTHYNQFINGGNSSTYGYYNVVNGFEGLKAVTSGSHNISMGANSLILNTTGSNNIAIGYLSLGTNVSGSQNIAIGSGAGRYNTLSNRLYINSLDRTNILGDTTKSIIYGYQDATASNQRLYLNSQLYLPYAASGVGTKALRINPSTGIVTYADTTAGGGGSQTWQQTLTSGSTLTGNNTIDGGGYNFKMNNTGFFSGRYDGTSTVTLANGGIAFGRAVDGKLTSTGDGNLVTGYVQDNNAEVSATGVGSLAMGYANDGAKILNTSNGSFVGGMSFHGASLVKNTGDGSFVWAGLSSSTSGTDTVSNTGYESFVVGNGGASGSRNLFNTGDRSFVFGSKYSNSESDIFSYGVGSQQFLIDGNTGNVGIGTSTPSTALHVIGAIKATDSVSFTGLLPMSASTDSVVVRDTNGKLGTTAKSAFGSTYSAGYGLSLASTTFSADSSVLMTKGTTQVVSGNKYHTGNIILSTAGTTDGSVATINGTQTLTNKRWTARVGSTTSSATPTINTDNTDIYKLTAQAADITSFTTNLSGTPVDGDILEIQVTGTAARAITWGASFVASTVALPTTTVTTATLTIIFQYYTTSSYGNNKWICVNYY